MKCSKKIKFATLIVAAVYAGLVSAHTQPGAIPIKKTKAAGTDMFEVTCSNNPTDGVTDHLELSVTDKQPANPARISIQALLPATGAATAISADAKDNDGKPSPSVSLAGGAGPYVMSVTKTRSRIVGRENYVITFHCVSASGDHTGTDYRMIQNQ